jgi:hypothetical protein
MCEYLWRCEMTQTIKANCEIMTQTDATSIERSSFGF